jgi:hypothetical protein
MGGAHRRSLSHAMVHHLGQGFFLRHHGETGIPFCLPSSDGGRCGERAAATSSASSRPTAWGRFDGSPARPRPRIASS